MAFGGRVGQGESAGGVGQSDGFAGPLDAEVEGVTLVGQYAARADRASGVLGGGEQIVGVDGGGGFGRPAHPRPGRGRGAYGAERLVGAVIVVDVAELVQDDLKVGEGGGGVRREPFAGGVVGAFGLALGLGVSGEIRRWAPLPKTPGRARCWTAGPGGGC